MSQVEVGFFLGALVQAGIGILKANAPKLRGAYTVLAAGAGSLVFAGLHAAATNPTYSAAALEQAAIIWVVAWATACGVSLATRLAPKQT